MDGNLDPQATSSAAQSGIHEPNEDAPISRLFAEVAAHCTGDRVTLGALADAFGERAFGMLILLLCIPALLPAMATVFGAPMLLLGAGALIAWRRRRA